MKDGPGTVLLPGSEAALQADAEGQPAPRTLLHPCSGTRIPTLCCTLWGMKQAAPPSGVAHRPQEGRPHDAIMAWTWWGTSISLPQGRGRYHRCHSSPGGSMGSLGW